MNKRLAIPDELYSTDDAKLAENVRNLGESLRAWLATKRAQRSALNIVDAKPESASEVSVPGNDASNELDTNPKDVSRKGTFTVTTGFYASEPRNILPKMTEKSDMASADEKPAIANSEVQAAKEADPLGDLDFTSVIPKYVEEPGTSTTGKPIPIPSALSQDERSKPAMPPQPKRIPRIREPDGITYEIPVSATAKIQAEASRSIVEGILNDWTVKGRWTADEIVESIAIRKTQEERWDTLKINEICIPDAEVSLWKSFFRMFKPSNSLGDPNKKYEDGDIYDIRLDGFERFYLSIIRKTEKKSFMFCIVNSKRTDQEKPFVVEILVKFPIREGEVMEVYRNRNSGPVLINSWTVKKVFLMKHREEEPKKEEPKKKRNGLLNLLGM